MDNIIDDLDKLFIGICFWFICFCNFFFGIIVIVVFWSVCNRIVIYCYKGSVCCY